MQERQYNDKQQIFLPDCPIDKNCEAKIFNSLTCLYYIGSDHSLMYTLIHSFSYSLISPLNTASALPHPVKDSSSQHGLINLSLEEHTHDETYHTCSATSHEDARTHVTLVY